MGGYKESSVYFRGIPYRVVYKDMYEHNQKVNWFFVGTYPSPPPKRNEMDSIHDQLLINLGHPPIRQPINPYSQTHPLHIIASEFEEDDDE